jgi:plastocyanin
MRIPLAGLAVLLLSSPASAAAPHTHIVVIDKMKFGAIPAGVRLGDTILWINRDMFRHTATARNGSFSVDLAPNARARMVVRAKGAVPFYCKFHPGMTGTLRVNS